MKSVAVLTPTYNRKDTLKRTYASLQKQTCKDFVWYIIDDGSSDDTEKEVCRWKTENNDFEIAYQKQRNGGKHRALNAGLKLINERYVTILDSDDWFDEKAIQTIVKDIPKVDNDNQICGLGYLRLDTQMKTIGRPYTKDEILDTFVNQRYNKRTFGDKAEVFKTEILRQFPFPEFENEKFLSEATVWAKMSGPYKMLFINKGFYICEYQAGGLSDGVRKRQFLNPLGSVEFYKVLSQKDFKFTIRIKYLVAYIVYSLACHRTLKQMKEDHKTYKFLLTLLYLPSKLLFKHKQKCYGIK